MTAYGFSKRDAQRLDRTNRRVEQMPDGTGQKQPRRHRPSPQAWAGFAVSATYDSGTDTVTVTCPAAIVYYGDTGSDYRQKTLSATSFDVVMNGETALGIYANLERGASAGTGIYTWFVSSSSAATSSQTETNSQILLGILTIGGGAIAWAVRNTAIDGNYYGSLHAEYRYGYTPATRTLSIGGFQVNQPVTPVGLNVVLPASTSGSVYITWDYGTSVQLDTTTAGHDQYRLVATFQTDGDNLIQLEDKLGAMIPGLHPIGLTQAIAITDKNDTVHTLTFSAGVLVAYTNV